MLFLSLSLSPFPSTFSPLTHQEKNNDINGPSLWLDKNISMEAAYRFFHRLKTGCRTVLEPWQSHHGHRKCECLFIKWGNWLEGEILLPKQTSRIRMCTQEDAQTDPLRFGQQWANATGKEGMQRLTSLPQQGVVCNHFWTCFYAALYHRSNNIWRKNIFSFIVELYFCYIRKASCY